MIPDAIEVRLKRKSARCWEISASARPPQSQRQFVRIRIVLRQPTDLGTRMIAREFGYDIHHRQLVGGGELCRERLDGLEGSATPPARRRYTAKPTYKRIREVQIGHQPTGCPLEGPLIAKALGDVDVSTYAFLRKHKIDISAASARAGARQRSEFATRIADCGRLYMAPTPTMP